MVRNRNYGVGTGYSSSGVTGRKNTFAFDEKIYAAHVWDELAGDELFTIEFYRKEAGTWVRKVIKTWRNTGFSTAYQYAWIKNYPPGEWRALFFCSHFGPFGEEFTINPKEAPPPPPPPEYPKQITRGPYSFTARNAEEQKQLREFLGLFPPGVDLDTYVGRLDRAGIQDWLNYWGKIWQDLGRGDLFSFTGQKATEYFTKLEVPPEMPIAIIAERWKDLTSSIRERNWLKAADDFFSLFLDPLLPEDYELAAEPIMIGIPGTPTIIAATTKTGTLTKIIGAVTKGIKALALDFKKRPLMSILLGIFATTEIPNYFNMRIFARNQVAESKGEDPAAITFPLNEQDSHFESLQFELGKAIRDKDKTRAEKILADMIETRDTFARLMEDKKETLVKIGLYETEVDNLAYFDDVITRARTEIATITPPEKIGTLIIRPTPEDAKVSVEGQIPSTGVYSAELPIGTYTYTVSKFGFVSESGSIEIIEETTKELNIQIFEEPEPPPKPPPLPPEEVIGKLTISIGPEEAADALVEIAGNPEITTAGTYDLSPGSYTVRASKEGFVSQTKTAYVSEKKDTVVSFILEKVEAPAELPTKATVQITSEPTNSDIYIDGEYTFTKTPYTTVLDAGTYIIRVQADGFFPQEASVTVGEGDEIIVPFVLEEIPEEEKPVVEYLPQTPYFPTYQAPTYYTPPVSVTPYSKVSLPAYNLLSPPSFKLQPKPSVPTTMEKEVLINIETTDAKPWKGKIFSVAWLDLSMPEAEPQVIVDSSEEEILKAFIEVFEQTGFTKIWGFKTIFDYRFIFNKLMLYRMQSKTFHDADLGDVKQLMDQVKEAFVYFPDKTGKLDDYGKELLGIGKYGTQEALLRRYIAGDIAYVERFQLQQIQVTKGLYDLFRFSAAGSSPASIPKVPNEAFPSQPLLSPQTPQSTQIKKCPNCLAEQPIGAKECDICKTKL